MGSSGEIPDLKNLNSPFTTSLGGTGVPHQAPVVTLRV